ncbi:hypothetical protein QVD17_01492 [Tagetes erecta]|uniref:Uncharacterized protein n=1 Tax=Tagetes erecta TaxID=13708 RepID=A0AAD8L503_TARER|nr:hypothetical protein QVD17_01492 [Tagetes erecta]
MLDRRNNGLLSRQSMLIIHCFKCMLLQDAQTKHGYNTPGPILLPCEVDLFYRVVAEMEAKDMEPHGFGFGFGYRMCSPFNPSWRTLVNAGEGCGGYGVLTPSRLVKMK